MDDFIIIAPWIMLIIGIFLVLLLSSAFYESGVIDGYRVGQGTEKDPEKVARIEDIVIAYFDAIFPEYDHHVSAHPRRPNRPVEANDGPDRRSDQDSDRPDNH